MFHCQVLALPLADRDICIVVEDSSVIASMETLNTVLGGCLAAVLGLGAFFVQEHCRKKSEKHKVANALVSEMLHTLKFLAAGHKTLSVLAKNSGSVSASEISQAFPSRRPIYVSLGMDVGALSEEAAEAAVNFDHYIQALERDFEFLVGGINPISSVDPETASKLANKSVFAIENTSRMVERMSSELGDTQTESLKNKIREIRKRVGLDER